MKAYKEITYIYMTMEFKLIELFNNKLKVFENGKVLTLGKRMNKGEYYEMKGGISNKGYKCLQLCFEGKYKKYLVHRIIALTFLNLDFEDKKQIIDHKNRDKLDNQVSNLRVVSYQQNNFNRNYKGYSKERNKYRARIFVNGKKISLGTYETEAEASNAYQQAKLIHHII
tara:strand:- start:108 stop:617 length:510 start_codon:yes stop_codon:yes gene_type:complete